MSLPELNWIMPRRYQSQSTACQEHHSLSYVHPCEAQFLNMSAMGILSQYIKINPGLPVISADNTNMAGLGPERKDLVCPLSVHHPSIGRQDVLPVQPGGVHSKGSEAVVVIGINAEDGVVIIKQWCCLMEVSVGKGNGNSKMEWFQEMCGRW